jgi:hypothetical protein
MNRSVPVSTVARVLLIHTALSSIMSELALIKTLSSRAKGSDLLIIMSS